MQPISGDYSRLLTVLRAVQPLVQEYASNEPQIPTLTALERNLADSIAQLETLTDLNSVITKMRCPAAADPA